MYREISYKTEKCVCVSPGQTKGADVIRGESVNEVTVKAGLLTMNFQRSYQQFTVCLKHFPYQMHNSEAPLFPSEA